MWGLSGVLLLRSSAAVLTPAHCCRGCPLAVRQCVVSSSSFPCLAWPGCGHNNIIIPMSSMACVHHHISLKYPSSANMSQRGRVGRRCCRGKGGKPRRLWWGKAESRGAYVVGEGGKPRRLCCGVEESKLRVGTVRAACHTPTLIRRGVAVSRLAPP